MMENRIQIIIRGGDSDSEIQKTYKVSGFIWPRGTFFYFL
jgi:hypothetical protein